MKRRTILVSFLLAAVMALGIGYAAITDTLDATGTTDISATEAEAAYNEDIYIDSIVANQAGDTASVNADNNDKCSYTVNTLKGKDDTATFTITIKNDGDVDSKITVSSTTNSNETFFVVTNTVGDGVDLAAGGTATVTVTVKLLKTPTENISATFTLEMKATSTAA